MNPKAVSKARARLATATKQLSEAQNSTDYDEFASHWYLFLVTAKNVYTQLEQGAKTSDQSRQWFGGKKRERREDPLLQYMFQARDDDEHGIGDVTKLEAGKLGIGRAVGDFGDSFRISMSSDGNGPPVIHEIESLDGKPILIEQIPAHVVLVTVTGRGNVTYEPPTEHLGKPLPDNLPITVGKLTLAYLESLLSDAESRAA